MKLHPSTLILIMVGCFISGILGAAFTANGIASTTSYWDGYDAARAELSGFTVACESAEDAMIEAASSAMGFASDTFDTSADVAMETLDEAREVMHVAGDWIGERTAELRDRFESSEGDDVSTH